MTAAVASGRSWRMWFVMTLMGIVALVIVIRLVLLQVADHAPLSAIAEEMQYQIVDREPWRGRILDRDGAALALNEVQYEVGASPDAIPVDDVGEVAEKLAPLLDRSRADIQAVLESGKGQRWVPLEKRVPKDVGEAIRDLRLPGVVVSVVQHRVYPHGTLAGQVLGFVADGEQVGYFGVEGHYDSKLAGEHVTAEEPLNPLEAIALPPPRPGTDLYLTIDRDVQFATEDVLARALQTTGSKSGTIIVMDPRTGAILAMASLPTYDPNHPPEDLQGSQPSNPAISAQYEPGSVFKVLTMAIALEEGIVTPESTYFDGGVIEVGGALIYNWNRGAWGVQDMTGLLAHSLNVGAATLSVQLGPERFYAGLRRFHVGEPLGVDLADEASGLLRLPGDADWHEADLGTNSFGQGVAVTPLQMISTVAAVANGGEMMRPHVVAATVQDGVRWEVPLDPIARPISPATAETLNALLVNAIAREVQNASVPGYTVAGKTGTASVVRPGGFYDPSATIGSFVGYLPADDPQLIILVKLDEPTSSPWGSVVAAPVFAELAQRLVVLLEIPPEGAAVR